MIGGGAGIGGGMATITGLTLRTAWVRKDVNNVLRDKRKKTTSFARKSVDIKSALRNGYQSMNVGDAEAPFFQR